MILKLALLSRTGVDKDDDVVVDTLHSIILLEFINIQ